MRSTKTRLAASVLAIALPLAPTAAHAETQTIEEPSAHHAGTHPTPTHELTEHSRLAIANAIESATAAAHTSLAAYEAQRQSDPLTAVFVEEQTAHAAIAVEAALAEVSHARTLVPASATALAHALDLIIDDLATLRS